MGPNDNPMIFLRGISFKEVEAVLDFMYNGQTKIDHEQLDAFLAAAEELKVRGLTQTTSNDTASTSRKRSITSEGAKREKSKKSKQNIPYFPGSSSSDPVVVKSEIKINEEDHVSLKDDDDFQDYPEAEIEGFDDGSYQDDSTTTRGNFPTDNKGKFPFVRR